MRISFSALAAAALLAIGAPAQAATWNYELDLVAEHAGWVPLLNGDPMLGVYTSPPLGETFKATFSLNSILLLPGSTNTIPLEAFHASAGDAVWSIDDVLNAYFVTDIYNNILSMQIFALAPSGDAFSVDYRTGRPFIDPIISSWAAIDSFGPGCAISTDFTFSGACFGSVNDDIVLTKLADGAPGDLGGGVPEPATWALLLLGFATVGSRIRSQRRTAAARQALA